ncbi:glycosyltransferase family 2 protein [Cognatilysobacter lacus]|uniref:Glycosyltransferase family 2 protein n=1 Tax=Cognatilysobacter lacus TaxID=1643323 RepID=A0A5D8Z9U9_9GAMM|nr:glycosyltransferase [Lysobacter lacus]TZF91437.1 glycosyltransferase family 2 protein [Lysobacter lacus]
MNLLAYGSEAAAGLPTPTLRERYQLEARDSADHRRTYVPVRIKYALALAFASAWTTFSVVLSLPWLHSLTEVFGRVLALVSIGFIAYVPGFMQAFLLATIALDRRPRVRFAANCPPVTVLVACYNEAANVADTLQSIAAQDYPGALEILVMDDGSTDATVAIAEATIAEAGFMPARFQVRVVTAERNQGKAAALNRGLAIAQNELVLTIDGDSYVFGDALRNIVERYLGDPPGTRAVAGAVLVRNSRSTWITRAQEWDYFHGIAAVKRMQSMYHGTLVAQGAFSLYEREALREVGGWPDCVGEDIVLSWAMLGRGWRVGYCEEAVLFTRVPERLRVFAQQRQRWSRGMLEAFKAHPSLLFKPRMTTLFIWWNALFLPTDLVYSLIFIPGVFAALFLHWYGIAGPMTLAVLPLALIWNAIIYRVQRRVFRRQELHVRRNIFGFLFYMLVYSMVLQPVCVVGYFKELIGLRKRWGTK